MFFVAVEAEALIIVDSGKKISLGQTQVFKSRKALAVVNFSVDHRGSRTWRAGT